MLHVAWAGALQAWELPRLEVWQENTVLCGVIHHAHGAAGGHCDLLQALAQQLRCVSRLLHVGGCLQVLLHIVGHESTMRKAAVRCKVVHGQIAAPSAGGILYKSAVGLYVDMFTLPYQTAWVLQQGHCMPTTYSPIILLHSLNE